MGTNMMDDRELVEHRIRVLIHEAKGAVAAAEKFGRFLCRELDRKTPVQNAAEIYRMAESLVSNAAEARSAASGAIYVDKLREDLSDPNSIFRQKK